MPETVATVVVDVIPRKTANLRLNAFDARRAWYTTTPVFHLGRRGPESGSVEPFSMMSERQ
jgi:hypothetical protein